MRVKGLRQRPQDARIRGMTSTGTRRAPVRAAVSRGLTKSPAPTTPRQQEEEPGMPSKMTPEWFSLVIGQHKSQYNEFGYWITNDMVLEGSIPADIEGTYFRNGPGSFEIGEYKLSHPFDGDGQILSVAFQDGRAFLRTKFVRTEGLVREQEAGKPLYRGAFTVGNPGSDGGWYNPLALEVKNIANTGVVNWGRKLLALYETDKPHALTPASLDTFGIDDLDGAVRDRMAAHYRIVPELDGSRRLVSFGAAVAPPNTEMTIWEYDEDWNQISCVEQTMPNTAWGFFHDMVVTEDYYIFVENPMDLNLWTFATKYMFGKACIAECIEFQKEKQVVLHVFPRPGKANPFGIREGEHLSVPFRGRNFFSFHHANAFQADGCIVVDTAGMPSVNLGFDTESPEYFEQPPTRLRRLVLDPVRRTVRQHLHPTCYNMEFPSVAPQAVGRAASHIYHNVSLIEAEGHATVAQAIGKTSFRDAKAGLHGHPWEGSVVLERWSAGWKKFCGEPMFIPRRGSSGEREDDGYVAAAVNDPENSSTELVILDAAAIAAGPVCRIRLPHHLPFGLHGSWSSRYHGPPAGAPDLEPYDIRCGVSLP